MKDTLVIYYSLEGNTELVATALAEKLDADILAVKPLKDIDADGFGKYFWGGSQVVMHTTPQLQPFDRDPGAYKNIVIGTPVWAFTFAPPIRTLLELGVISGKKVAVFCCHEGGPAKTLDKLSGILTRSNRVLGRREFFAPKQQPDITKREAADWAKLLLEEFQK
jgi:flavodoxin